MCGLVGFFGDSSVKHTQVFEDMFQMDVVRGRDSCGIALMRRKGPPIVMKDITAPSWLLEEGKYLEHTRKYDYTCLMGHNRFATKGKVTMKNAHPFRIGRIVMAHNGTLESVYKLPNGNTFDTDSEALCNSIAEIGIEETWKRMIGAAAITFYDTEAKTLNIITNGKRPIHFAYTKDGRGIFWASEAEMLRYCANRREVELRENKVFFLPEHMLFTFSYDGKEVTHTSKQLQPYVFEFPKKDADYYKNLASYYPYGHFDDEDAEFWDRKGNSAANVATANIPIIMGPKKENNNIVRIHHNDVPKDPYEKLNIRTKLISEEDFNRDYDRCTFCNAHLFGDYEHSVILNYDRKIAVCSECADTADCQGRELEGKLL